MQILVTPRAEKHFDSIVDYIRGEWGEQTAGEFIQKTDEIFKLLAGYPAMGSVEKGDIRGFRLSRHTRILYRVKGDRIIILGFFDVRQDPRKKFG